MLAIRFSSFLLWFDRSPIAASPTCVSMRGDSRSLACIQPPGKVGSHGFNFCRIPCTRFPQLLTSWALVCSLRCRFIAASLLSGPARFRVDTVPWLCALSLNTSIRIRVWRALYSVLLGQRDLTPLLAVSYCDCSRRDISYKLKLHSGT